MNLELLSNNAKPVDGKPSILFVHGMWHGAWVWAPKFLPFFEELGHKAYAVSLSNHGNSPRKKAFNLLTINDYVNDLKEVIDTLETKPILVGHSMGGFVVQKYLENNEAAGAVLMASVPPFGIWTATINVLKKFPLAFLKANITFNMKYVIDTASKYRHILCSDNITEEEVNTCLKKTNTESYLAYVQMLGLSLVNTNKINSPLLIIGGDSDNSVPVKLLEKTASKYGVNPVVFKGMGHNMMLEPDYKKVGLEIDNWIKTL